MVVGKKGRREGGLLVTATTFVCCSYGRKIAARSNAASSERRQAFVHRTARAVPHDDCRKMIAAGGCSNLDASLAESNFVSPNISKQDEHPAHPAMTLFLQAGVTHGGTRVRDTQQRDTPSGKRRN